MPQPSGAWVSWLLPIPSRELAEPDRVVSGPGEVPHPQTAARPTHAAGATPRSRPTCIGRYAPALAPRCDDEWDESTDRSEERRVGKEGRCRGERYREKEKKEQVDWREKHR